jgi:hypothetical protein
LHKLINNWFELISEWFVVNCTSRIEKAVEIFVYNVRENYSTTMFEIPGNCKRLIGMRVHGDNLLATFDKSTALLWNLRTKRLLKIVNFGQRCKKVTPGLSGFDLLAFNRKGYSKTMSRFSFQEKG